MPHGDATGPWNLGPMTGRRVGLCAGFEAPGCAYPAAGRGSGPSVGFGGGYGRGRRHSYFATGLPGWARIGQAPAAGPAPFAWRITPEQEASALKAQRESLKSALDAIGKRIEELEPQSAQ
jgi:hypothetical protein